jgi:hypothetical protein
MMAETFDVTDFVSAGGEKRSRYERRLAELTSKGFYTQSIESAVGSALANITDHGTRSFVIYGEPQSGKTEMMIALTARLLDEGRRIIIILLNDSVQLLEQNLDRFLRSGLDPAPKKFNEILDPGIDVSKSTWVIFCKKNSADLQNLLAKLEGTTARTVIDDEADFASPNSKINQNEKTKINDLVGQLLGSDGIYIGVTATPARLDLNNTFDNDNQRWIDFPPHPRYSGQEVFFPTSTDGFTLGFNLTFLPEEGDDPRFLRTALLSFLVNVGYLNTQVNKEPTNYSMLVHTSGLKADHIKDYQQIIALLTVLKDSSNAKFEKRVREIFDIAAARYSGSAKEITTYVLDHINQSDVVVMNSDTASNAAQYRRATSPATLFTIAIGGNIVSRGVTFENLLTMFFTRDVKHKIQQDTYIQRARMFGERGAYLPHFELHIPAKLYFDWQKCFVFHRLALSFIRAKKGTPIWLEDKRIAAVASSSIDRAAVALDSGEMSWDMFDYDDAIDQMVDAGQKDPLALLRQLRELVGDNALPDHVLSFIESFSFSKASIAVHKTTALGSGYGTEEERSEIRRRRGFIATNALEQDKFPKAIHHIKVFRNDSGKARVFYKYAPEMGSIRFLKNVGSGSAT